MIKVLVVDDEALLRSAFSSLIEAQDDLEVVGAAADGQQAVGYPLRYVFSSNTSRRLSRRVCSSIHELARLRKVTRHRNQYPVDVFTGFELNDTP